MFISFFGYPAYPFSFSFIYIPLLFSMFVDYTINSIAPFKNASKPIHNP
ncbi:hypothetical protein [Flavobacterium myungsuense]|uniref:Uncharacterized protein n=1 Tax=Flavobacterium myungsuense TaxID=651823 RepID=A0ABW3J510_9FLAO